MKVIIEEITRSHPAKSPLTFRRITLGSYEADRSSFDALNDTHNGELWFGVDRSCPRICLQAMNVRLAVLDGEVGAIVDVMNDETRQLCGEWVKSRFSYISSDHGVQPKEYVAWAKAHEVWP